MAAITVIVIALGFAWIYHRKALQIIMSAVSRGAILGSPVNEDVGARGVGPRVVGPSCGKPSEEFFFVLIGVDASTAVKWTAADGSPSSGDEQTFTTKFAAGGDHTVQVAIDGVAEPLTKTVTVGAASGSGAPIAIPFVLKNWGRLVIVLFGVGVIAALMVTKTISAEAGIGILGALLGVGATAAAAGGAGGDTVTSGVQPPSGDSGTVPDSGSVLGRRGKK
ncbi:PKD domain-containing protein [Microbacterium sp. SLBN-146]|uniref:PKD domain-containing protein n=1 Tax=Microbacterium sp. SLBN-146 TaxID=2768457 RepID=UPI00114FD809|nr:PKD domain-containing protein [Microbacterium sp. SLBN-146]